MKRTVLFALFSINFVSCRDFYVGMFKKNDLLVAQDYLYKERVSHRFAYAKYGRIFKCPITYFRVVDRLGVGRGPQVKIIRGGLRKKYVVLQLTSPYNRPISVNIYAGCANNMPPTTRTTKATTKERDNTADTTIASDDVTDSVSQGDGQNTTESEIDDDSNNNGGDHNENPAEVTLTTEANENAE